MHVPYKTCKFYYLKDGNLKLKRYQGGFDVIYLDLGQPLQLGMSQVMSRKVRNRVLTTGGIFFMFYFLTVILSIILIDM